MLIKSQGLSNTYLQKQHISQSGFKNSTNSIPPTDYESNKQNEHHQSRILNLGGQKHINYADNAIIQAVSNNTSHYQTISFQRAFGG